MQRQQRFPSDNLHEKYSPNLHFNKSPLKRQNVKHMNPARSPIRSRTPTRYVSPIKSSVPFPASIKFITNVSPVRQKPSNHENQSEFSNGKSIKYINSHYTDKIYQTGKRDKNQEFNKKSERQMNDQNRLFGKIVEKIQSGKKSGNKGQECSYKTSVFENSENKMTRMEQTAGRNQGGVSRQLFTKLISNQPKSDRKPLSKPKQNALEQSQGLSCLVYKIKNHPKVEKELKDTKNTQIYHGKESSNAAMPSILAKRKSSKSQTQVDHFPKTNTTHQMKKVAQSQDFSDFNAILEKIERGYQSKPTKTHQDLVKMSIKVDQSLNMDPFI